MKQNKIITYVILMVLGEFFILLDAGFVGYLLAGGDSPKSAEIIVFWVLLVLGVLLRYFAERSKNN